MLCERSALGSRRSESWSDLAVRLEGHGPLQLARGDEPEMTSKSCPRNHRRSTPRNTRSGAFVFASSGLAQLQDPGQIAAKVDVEDDLRRLRSVDRRAAPEGVCQRYIVNSRITGSGISCGAAEQGGPAAAGSPILHRCNRAHSMAAAALRP